MSVHKITIGGPAVSAHVLGGVVGELARRALRVQEQRAHLVDVALADLDRRAGLCARVDARQDRRRRQQLHRVSATRITEIETCYSEQEEVICA